MRQMIITGLLLCLFAIVGTGLVSLTYLGTEERIEQAERAAMLRSLHAIVPPQQVDNDIYHDMIEVTDPALLGSKEPVQVYRARQGDKPVAALLTPIAPNGYGGRIKLLVGINYDGTLAGVRVISHRETPGLGDDIEVERSDWIHGFDGQSLAKLSEKQWKVKKDGGVFDQFTGATITPRAVVDEVYKTLKYYQTHRDELFATPALRQEDQAHD